MGVLPQERQASSSAPACGPTTEGAGESNVGTPCVSQNSWRRSWNQPQSHLVVPWALCVLRRSVIPHVQECRGPSPAPSGSSCQPGPSQRICPRETQPLLQHRECLAAVCFRAGTMHIGVISARVLMQCLHYSGSVPSGSPLCELANGPLGSSLGVL